MPKSVYNPTSNDIFPGTGPRPNSDTVGEFGVRSMFPPDPSGIWLDRGLSGPHSPLLPPVVGTAANSPTVSTFVLGQDNEISWVDWDLDKSGKELAEFV